MVNSLLVWELLCIIFQNGLLCGNVGYALISFTVHLNVRHTLLLTVVNVVVKFSSYNVLHLQHYSNMTPTSFEDRPALFGGLLPMDGLMVRDYQNQSHP